jgi:hypothetical protein
MGLTGPGRPKRPVTQCPAADPGPWLTRGPAVHSPRGTGEFPAYPANRPAPVTSLAQETQYGVLNAEEMAYAEENGSTSGPDPPRRPDPPRCWGTGASAGTAGPRHPQAAHGTGAPDSAGGTPIPRKGPGGTRTRNARFPRGCQGGKGSLPR